jgi:hypothetical protein
VAPDAFDARFGQEFFHFIFKFLPDKVVFQDGQDQDFFQSWDRLAGKDPAMNDLGVGREGQGRQDQAGYKEKKTLSECGDPQWRGRGRLNFRDVVGAVTVHACNLRR